MATRESVDEPWSPPIKLGDTVNTTAGETRPSLSWNAHALYFGAPGPESMSDIYIAWRDKLKGQDE